MEKLYSNIVGMPVIEDDLHRPITTIKDVLIDPENGKLVALVVNGAGNMIIAPNDIVFWGEVIQINSMDSIIEDSEVLRVEAVLKLHTRIFGNKVETKKGEILGKVLDFSLDNHTFSLKKLFVGKEILGLVRYGTRIIIAKDIVEILPKKIVVKADKEEVPETESVALEDLATG